MKIFSSVLNALMLIAAGFAIATGVAWLLGWSHPKSSLASVYAIFFGVAIIFDMIRDRRLRKQSDFLEYVSDIGGVSVEGPALINLPDSMVVSVTKAS